MSQGDGPGPAGPVQWKRDGRGTLGPVVLHLSFCLTASQRAPAGNPTPSQSSGSSRCSHVEPLPSHILTGRSHEPPSGHMIITFGGF